MSQNEVFDPSKYANSTSVVIDTTDKEKLLEVPINPATKTRTVFLKGIDSQRQSELESFYNFFLEFQGFFERLPVSSDLLEDTAKALIDLQAFPFALGDCNRYVPGNSENAAYIKSRIDSARASLKTIERALLSANKCSVANYNKLNTLFTSLDIIQEPIAKYLYPEIKDTGKKAA